MPSPWVRRAMGAERAADGSTLVLPPKVYGRFNWDRANAGEQYPITADDRTAMALRDITEPYQGSDTADAVGTTRALRAFGIVR